MASQLLVPDLLNFNGAWKLIEKDSQNAEKYLEKLGVSYLKRKFAMHLRGILSEIFSFNLAIWLPKNRKLQKPKIKKKSLPIPHPRIYLHRPFQFHSQICYHSFRKNSRN